MVLYYFGYRYSANCDRLRKETSSGAFACNECVLQVVNLDLPFGGVGHSGYGKFNGETGFRTFSNGKSVLIKPNLGFFPFDQIFPPTPDHKKPDIMNSMEFMATKQAKCMGVLKMIAFICIACLLLLVFHAPILDFGGRLFSGKIITWAPEYK